MYHFFHLSLLVSFDFGHHFIFLKMYEGKEMRSDLIAELRTTHALQSPERKEKKAKTEEILSEQRARERHQHKVQCTYMYMHMYVYMYMH